MIATSIIKCGNKGTDIYKMLNNTSTTEIPQQYHSSIARMVLKELLVKLGSLGLRRIGVSLSPRCYFGENRFRLGFISSLVVKESEGVNLAHHFRVFVAKPLST